MHDVLNDPHFWINRRPGRPASGVELIGELHRIVKDEKEGGAIYVVCMRWSPYGLKDVRDLAEVARMKFDLVYHNQTGRPLQPKTRRLLQDHVANWTLNDPRFPGEFVAKLTKPAER